MFLILVYKSVFNAGICVIVCINVIYFETMLVLRGYLHCFLHIGNQFKFYNEDMDH